MFCCMDCGKIFETPKEFYEKHALDAPPYERHLYCGSCGGEVIPLKPSYCYACGARLPMGRKKFCNNDCRRQGERLWRRQRERLKRMALSPVNKIIRMLEGYNREHQTRYSYGQFVSLILPRLAAGEI